MKKQTMSLAVTAALLGGTVSAYGSMYTNDRGLGEALIYPLYSAANGNDTQIHIVNTTDYTKAVKVRFIEARNSAEVLDFNLYLSPQDEWAGVVTANPAEGATGAIIRTVDNSCTVPELGTAGGANVGELAGTQTELPNGKILRDQPFVNFKYLSDADLSEDAETGLIRTTEGYIEIIEMGQLDPSFGLGNDAVHNASGVPNDCAELVAAWTTTGADVGIWDQDPQAQLLTSWMGGGLYGYGVLINVAEGTASGYDAVAIEGFNDAARPSPLHFAPGDESPSLEDATDEVVIFNDGASMDYFFDDGKDAVSALFTTIGISNDYVIDPDLNALTDWVITMPTKRFYVQGDPALPALPPFSSNWNGLTACEPVAIGVWDREEAFEPPSPDGPVFSPQPPATPGTDTVICTEVSVVTFGDGSAVNASDAIRYGFSPDYNEGWAALSFAPTLVNTTLPAGARQLTSSDGEVFEGLPATGFAVFEYVNGTLEGGSVLANYAAAVDHKTDLVISAGTAP